jgi:hypothetical protein
VQTILVLDSERVLGAAILYVLQAESDLAVSGFSPTSAWELCEKLRCSSVDTLILDSAAEVAPEVQRNYRRFCNDGGLRVIVVDVDDNLVSVDGLPGIPINGLYQLVDIVRSWH